MTQPVDQIAKTRESLVALGLMSSAMLIIPIMDIIAKYLSTSLPPLEITFGRFFFQFLICILIALVAGRWQQLRSKHLGINLLRGTLLALASLFFFTAVKFMPVATAISIFFVEPMILTILAALILKEKFGPRRVVAIVIGLVGALLILRPSFADVGPAALLPLCTALLFAFYLIINRRYAGADSLLAIQFSAGLAGSVILGVALLIGSFLGLSDYTFIMPSGPNILLLISIGAISFACHGLVVMAFQRGEASLLAPLNYIEIVSATLFGYLVFGDFPDTMTWVGISLIVSSGLYIAHREQKTRSK
ncbi:DMT family transporter [Roseibium algae]|uniref:DMT family transporter n=1 Tax=Roseibium algae TaxID=3123038 RepID=A0ABU8THC3_9HYPH